MRGTRLIPIALIALALGGCMQRQPAYYMVDPSTGRMVPLARSTMPPAYWATYGQQASASASPQPVYSQPLASAQAASPAPQPQAENRGLFSSSPAAAQQSYAQAQPYGP